ncbi:hypothetical protein CDAR_393431 [Caerostris darwini]|uniref:Uncharacterized protein n=1 Tax=Caerostris darwini TaxID=1538125 RepID=A0AAV4W891_9ARAC|nr:hypothetical protein CDAR_393431 [Caerostris darwini]
MMPVWWASPQFHASFSVRTSRGWAPPRKWTSIDPLEQRKKKVKLSLVIAGSRALISEYINRSTPSSIVHHNARQNGGRNGLQSAAIFGHEG